MRASFVTKKGSVLFETVLAVFLLSGVLYVWHVRIIGGWQARLDAWEGERLRYDGDILWKP